MKDWILFKQPDGITSCDNSNKSSDEIIDLLRLLEKKFKVSYNNKALTGLDGVYLEVTIYDQDVTIGWDIWSGIFIMSHKGHDGTIIESIYNYLTE